MTKSHSPSRSPEASGGGAAPQVSGGTATAAPAAHPHAGAGNFGRGSAGHLSSSPVAPAPPVAPPAAQPGPAPAPLSSVAGAVAPCHAAASTSPLPLLPGTTGAPAAVAAAPSSPPSASKRPDTAAPAPQGPAAAAAAGGTAAGGGGGSAAPASGASSSAVLPSSDSIRSASVPSSAVGGSRSRYGKRASDSSGGAASNILFASPPHTKGSSSSGAGPPAGGGGGGGGGTGAAAHGHHSAQGPGSAAGGMGAQSLAGRGRLQQLGQRLNLGLGLVRKKHTTFAPGVSGGGGGGGNGALSGPEDGGNGGEGGNGGDRGGGGGGGGGGAAAGSSLHGSGQGAAAAAGTSSTGMAPLGFSLGGFGGLSFGGLVRDGGAGNGAGAAAGGAGGGRGDGHTSSKVSVEEFNPPNHPVNPFSYLATPFRVMAKTKAGVAMGRYATTALRLKRDGLPPASYMWLWLGNFKRWHRRYFVASEAPGVLLIYKRANMKGKVWSTSLCDASVDQDDSHPRQIRLVTPAGTIFLRVLRPEERQPWIACLRDSVATFRRHKEVVDGLTAAGQGGEAAGTVSALPSLSTGAVEQDVEQRRRIRVRLHDRLAELAPLVSEVERHLGIVGSFLAGAASGFGHLTGPLLSHSASISHGLNARGPRGSMAPAAAAAAAAAAHAADTDTAGPHHHPPEERKSASTSPLAPAAHAAAADMAAATAAEAAAAAAAAAASAAAAGGGGRGAPESSPGSARHSGSRAAAAAAVLGGGTEGEPVPERAAGRVRSRSRALSGLAVAHSPSLAAAVSALVDAVRATLHNDAVRITALEAENAALNKTVNILRASTHRNASRSRGPSTPGLSGAAAGILGAPLSAAARAMAAAGASGGGGGSAGAGVGPDDAASEGGSVCTADEDAFDVVEAFDDGVDYSILDDDAPHLHHRLGVDDDEGPYVQHGSYPEGGDEEEETDEDAEEDAAELAQQAEVLNALEVVRQVEYITANDKDAQLKTLLTADTPPPPDAEEEEGGKGKRKSRGKGEDTDATLDDDDDEDSDEAAISAGGAAEGAGRGSGARRPYAGRDRLPAPKPLGRGFSIWSILKNMIGRDLTKITMPATINEPLSMTQRLAEVLEYRSLLERAASTPDSTDRLMLVSCWLLAGYNSQPLRDNKPFNPLLGETFEWQAADGSSRYICEQVSHHPPVSCFVAEGGGPQGYELYGEVETRTKFWGKTIDCILAGHMSLRLKAFGEEYRFNLGNLVINDIILGRYWVDLSCDFKVRNITTGDSARLLVKPCRGYAYLKERGKVSDAVVCDAEGREVWRITGSCMSSLSAALTPEAAAARGEGATTEPQLIWTKDPELPNPMEQYWMTRFALGLNDPADPHAPHLPPTDVRFRTDMRALELGEWNRATSEKLRLEEKQRTARRIRKEANEEYHPRWFRQVLSSPKEMIQPASQPGAVWEYTNEYWDVRARKDWGELPDLF